MVGFMIVLAIAIGGSGFWVSRTAAQENELFRQNTERARASRAAELVARAYADGADAINIQAVAQQAGNLVGWQVVVHDTAGAIVANSFDEGSTSANFILLGTSTRPTFDGGGGPSLLGRRDGTGQFRQGGFGQSDLILEDGTYTLRIADIDSGETLGSVMVTPSEAGIAGLDLVQEPSVTRLVSSLNTSLVLTGILAAMVGVVLVFFMSRRILTPVRELSEATSSLSKGDLSQRVASTGNDEVGQLGTRFNSMAEALEQAEQVRQNLMADVAHELRTPVSNIQGYLEAVKDGLLSPDDETVDTLFQQTRQLAHLVEDLRLLALAEAGALSLNRQPDSLREVLHDAVEAVQPRAKARDIDVSLVVPTDLPLVHIDRTRITQVVDNLVDNAITHTPDGGTVTVKAQVVDSELARVSITDTGPGIAQEDLQHIFDRFYRTDPSRARSTGGAGLGLSIAKHLVEAHGGAIYVESTVGEGSTFIFELPLTSS